MYPKNIEDLPRVTVDKESKPKTSKEWTAIRDECVSGGQLTDDCNLVAATHGADLVVVMKKLVCGCLLYPEDVDEIIL